MSVPILALRFVREETLPYDRRKTVRQPGDAAAVVRERLQDCVREEMLSIMLDTRHRVLGVYNVGRGGIDAVQVEPRGVLTAALLRNAAGVILAHNHPSGDPEPSADDARVTAKVAEAGNVVGVKVLDHIIIGHGGRFVSLQERGVLR